MGGGGGGGGGGDELAGGRLTEVQLLPVAAFVLATSGPQAALLTSGGGVGTLDAVWGIRRSVLRAHCGWRWQGGRSTRARGWRDVNLWGRSTCGWRACGLDMQGCHAARLGSRGVPTATQGSWRRVVKGRGGLAGETPRLVCGAWDGLAGPPSKLFQHPATGRLWVLGGSTFQPPWETEQTPLQSPRPSPRGRGPGRRPTGGIKS